MASKTLGKFTKVQNQFMKNNSKYHSYLKNKAYKNNFCKTIFIKNILKIFKVILTKGLLSNLSTNHNKGKVLERSIDLVKFTIK